MYCISPEPTFFSAGFSSFFAGAFLTEAFFAGVAFFATGVLAALGVAYKETRQSVTQEGLCKEKGYKLVTQLEFPENGPQPSSDASGILY